MARSTAGDAVGGSNVAPGLGRQGETAPTDADRAEDVETQSERADLDEDAGARTSARLDEWRDVERDARNADPTTAEGGALRARADEARSAFHEAEDAEWKRRGPG